MQPDHRLLAARAGLATLLLCGVLQPALAAEDRPPGLFDTPLAVTRQPLPPNTVNPGAKTQISCHRYPGFVVRLRYIRVYEAECSLARDPAGCWRAVRAATGLTAATPPDCLAAYERERDRVPAYADQAFDNPTVIDYEVEVTLADGRATITPAASAALACRPAD